MAQARAASTTSDERPQLIVLLGYRNHSDGTLFKATEARCDLAVAQALEHPATLILPTGSFGPNFNQSANAHGRLLTEYLVAKGLSRSRILPFTRTSRTLEDVLAVRRKVVELDATDLIVVTSEFHVERCRFLFARVLGELPITFLGAVVPESVHSAERTMVERDLSNEASKLASERGDWMDFPLYGPTESQREFPHDVYKNAADEQRGYDRVSYLLISGVFISFAAPYTLDGSDLLPLGFALSIFLMVLLFVLYLRVAAWANRARRLLYLIEAQWSQPGFSYDILHGERPVKRMSWPLPQLASMVGFTRAILMIVVVLALAQLAIGVRTYLRVPETVNAGVVACKNPIHVAPKTAVVTRLPANLAPTTRSPPCPAAGRAR